MSYEGDCNRHCYPFLSASISRREWECASAPLRTVAGGRLRSNSNGVRGEGGKEAPPENARRAWVANGDGEGEEVVQSFDGEGDAAPVDGSRFGLRRAGGTRELSGRQKEGALGHADPSKEDGGHPWLVGSPLRPPWHLTSPG